MEIILAAIIGAAATLSAAIITSYFKIKLSTKSKSQLLRSHVDQNANVYAALEYTMERLSCDRVHVFEFHNGETYYSGSSQQKFSNTYEVVRDGISSECTKLQNLRISNFNILVKDTIKEEMFLCEDVSKIHSCTEREHLKNQGVKSVYSFPIKTLTGKPIGIFSVDYVAQIKKLTEDQIKFLQNQSTIIGGYISAN